MVTIKFLTVTTGLAWIPKVFTRTRTHAGARTAVGGRSDNDY